MKRRDKKTNAEANKLRNHISMTEYEITRLNKSLKKRLGNLQALEKENQNHTLTEENQQVILDYNSEIQALHSQINHLTLRQQGFKNDYLELTGKTLGFTFIPIILYKILYFNHVFGLGFIYRGSIRAFERHPRHDGALEGRAHGSQRERPLGPDTHR